MDYEKSYLLYKLILIGYAAVSTTTVMCSHKEQGSMVIVSSGDGWKDADNEAESIGDRIREVLSDNL